MTADEKAQRLADLRKKLKARQGKSLYRESVPLIEAEIARVEAEPTDG